MAIMNVLWSRSEATASEVHEALRPTHDLAPTTVSTMIQRLAKKGVVTHRSEGRQYVYRASVSRDAVQRSMVSDLVDRVFRGNPKALVSHLVSEEALGEDDLAALSALIEEHRKQAEK
jgi:predicted transcriptional regulator